jgi:hypothetical protein
MKSISIKSLVAMLAILAVSFSACKKDEDEPIVMEEEHVHNHGEIVFQFHHMIGNQEIEYGEIYNLNGLNVSFDRIQYYVHDISFYPDHLDENALSLDGKYLLVSGNSGLMDLGDVELSYIDKLRFKIGVDPVANSITSDEFIALPVSNPLSVQNPPMHWSWATGSGYKFAAFEGTYNDGANNFIYHTATNAMLRQVNMLNVHLDVDHDNPNIIHINLDLGLVFDGIDIAADDTEHGAGGTNPLMMDNMVTAFDIQ